MTQISGSRTYKRKLSVGDDYKSEPKVEPKVEKHMEKKMDEQKGTEETTKVERIKEELAPPLYEAAIRMPIPISASNTSSSTSTTTVSGSNLKRRHNNNNDDLVSAAEALTQLTKSMTPPPASLSYNQLPPPTRSLHSGVTSPISSLSINDHHNHEHPLVTKVNKVSKHPIVTNAFTYYEEQKRKYASFNYAAEIVEKAAIPVVNKIELNLNNRYQAKQSKLEEKSVKKRRKLSKKRSCSIYKKNETKKRLQFCLHILKLANDNINSKVFNLQERMLNIEKEKRLKNEEVKQDKPDNKPNNEVAQQTKTEIITTVKKIIHLISNFKPSSLNTSQTTSEMDQDLDNISINSNNPNNLELKSTIRDIILKLPITIQQTAITNSTSAQQANDKIFVFAKESLDMIGKLTNVFNEQLEKAENWVNGDESDNLNLSRQLSQSSSTPSLDSVIAPIPLSTKDSNIKSASPESPQTKVEGN